MGPSLTLPGDSPSEPRRTLAPSPGIDRGFDPGGGGRLQGGALGAR
jgi:hypothetical protein